MSDVTKFRRLGTGNKAVCTKQLQNCEPVLETKDEVQTKCLHKRLGRLLDKIKKYDKKILDVVAEVEDEIVQQSEHDGKVDAIAKLELALTKISTKKKKKNQ